MSNNNGDREGAPTNSEAATGAENSATTGLPPIPTQGLARNLTPLREGSGSTPSTSLRPPLPQDSGPRRPGLPERQNTGSSTSPLSPFAPSSSNSFYGQGSNFSESVASFASDMPLVPTAGPEQSTDAAAQTEEHGAAAKAGLFAAFILQEFVRGAVTTAVSKAPSQYILHDFANHLDANPNTTVVYGSFLTLASACAMFDWVKRYGEPGIQRTFGATEETARRGAFAMGTVFFVASAATLAYAFVRPENAGPFFAAVTEMAVAAMIREVGYEFLRGRGISIAEAKTAPDETKEVVPIQNSFTKEIGINLSYLGISSLVNNLWAVREIANGVPHLNEVIQGAPQEFVKKIANILYGMNVMTEGLDDVSAPLVKMGGEKIKRLWNKEPMNLDMKIQARHANGGWVGFDFPAWAEKSSRRFVTTAFAQVIARGARGEANVNTLKAYSSGNMHQGKDAVGVQGSALGPASRALRNLAVVVKEAHDREMDEQRATAGHDVHRAAEEGESLELQALERQAGVRRAAPEARRSRAFSLNSEVPQLTQGPVVQEPEHFAVGSDSDSDSEHGSTTHVSDSAVAPTQLIVPPTQESSSQQQPQPSLPGTAGSKRDTVESFFDRYYEEPDRRQGNTSQGTEPSQSQGASFNNNNPQVHQALMPDYSPVFQEMENQGLFVAPPNPHQSTPGPSSPTASNTSMHNFPKAKSVFTQENVTRSNAPWSVNNVGPEVNKVRQRAYELTHNTQPKTNSDIEDYYKEAGIAVGSNAAERPKGIVTAESADGTLYVENPAGESRGSSVSRILPQDRPPKMGVKIGQVLPPDFKTIGNEQRNEGRPREQARNQTTGSPTKRR